MTSHELDFILQDLGLVPQIYGEAYDPISMIRHVNTLQPLGKQKALAAIERYIELAPSEEKPSEPSGMFLVLRVLFDVPELTGCFQPIRVGAPVPPPPLDPQLFPRFPMLIVDDVPLLLVRGYMLLGFPESIDNHIRYCRDHCNMRQNKLSPTNSPLDVLDKIERMPQWPSFLSSADSVEDQSVIQVRLMNQLLRLIGTVYRPSEEHSPPLDLSLARNYQHSWAVIRKEFAAIKIEWNSVANEYHLPSKGSL